jgi:hypothetical protein
MLLDPLAKERSIGKAHLLLSEMESVKISEV